MRTRRLSPFAVVKNKNLSKDDIHVKIHDHMKNLIDGHSNCINVNNKRPTSCTCITMFRDNNCFDQLLEKLEKYESKDTEGRKLFLHGVLTHGNLKKEELKRGAKRSSIYALTGVETIDGETVFVCSNTLKNLFCIGNKQWKILQTDAMLPDPKSTERYENNMNKASKCTQNVIDFLYNMGKDEGEMHATRFVRVETTIGIRDQDFTLINLPSYYTKRQLYETFCFQNGYKVKAFSDGSYVPVSEYKLRNHDDGEMALWPVGSEPQLVCSWPSFLRIWKAYLPNLKIKPPSLDTCNLCNEYAKYMIAKKKSSNYKSPCIIEQ